MVGTVRRSRRLQQKAKKVVEQSEAAANSSDELGTGDDDSVDSDFVERKAVTATRRSTRKRKQRSSEDQLATSKQKKRREGNESNEKLKGTVDGRAAKQKRRPPKSVTGKKSLDGEGSATKSKTKKNQNGRKRRVASKLSDDSTDSSLSDDEWEDVGDMDDRNDGLDGTTVQSISVEVTIKKPKTKIKPPETVGTRRARFIQLHVNQKLRERQINCHKMHLLCYIAHLRIWARALVRSDELTSLCLSVIPEEYIAAAHHCFDIETVERFLRWFRATFHPAEKIYLAKSGFCNVQMERLEELVADQVFENDKDLASLLFLCLIALKQTARICLSCQPIPFKLAARQPCSEHIEALIMYYGSRKLTADDYAEWPKKLEETVKKIVVPLENITVSGRDGTNVAEEKSRKKRKTQDNDDDEISAVEKEKGILSQKRNYWVEYWDENSNRWICLDPWKRLVDKPEKVEADVTLPMHYVLCIDNECGMRDVTARYASKYLTPQLRRMWANQDWWEQTLKVYRSKNREHERLEDVAIQDFLFSRPKPETVPEYRNHPLYALEKHLSKYEIIYPENQQPIGQINGLDIYPRSSVHRLDGAINWMKQFRSIRPGEKPYKMVQRRPSKYVPPEYREMKGVDLYGRWQTVPYITPKVVDGRVPRNEFGNLYVYKNSMVPDGCAHLRLNGLLTIARQLDIDCVPAVVGWNHCRGGTHPILDGCVVLKEHEQQLREAWSKHYEKKKIATEMKRKQRILKNWRRLVKGLLTMRKVRAKFAYADRRELHVDEKLESEEAVDAKNVTPATDDIALAWPPTAFTLPGTGSGS